MATITQQPDGTLTMTLSPIEQDTLSGLPTGQLDAYVTLWLQERATQVFADRFAKLAPQDQGELLLKLRQTATSAPVTKGVPA